MSTSTFVSFSLISYFIGSIALILSVLTAYDNINREIKKMAKNRVSVYAFMSAGAILYCTPIVMDMIFELSDIL